MPELPAPAPAEAQSGRTGRHHAAAGSPGNSPKHYSKTTPEQTGVQAVFETFVAPRALSVQVGETGFG
jgi:hypothetical protein